MSSVDFEILGVAGKDLYPVESVSGPKMPKIIGLKKLYRK